MRKKKLVRVGNSLAIFIDRAFCQVLRLSETSLVRLETDGRSLIVVPTGEHATPRPKLRSQTGEMQQPAETSQARLRPEHVSPLRGTELRTALQAPGVVQALMGLCMPNDAFRRVYHDEVRERRGGVELFMYGLVREWMETGLHYTPTPAVFATMKRLTVCLEAKEGGADWDGAVERALREVPMVHEPPSPPPSVTMEDIYRALDEVHAEDERTRGWRKPAGTETI